MNNRHGFTLIELLIVVLIIGILAAIAIPVFNGQRNKAKNAKAQSSLRNALGVARSYYSTKESYTGFNLEDEDSSYTETGLTYWTSAPGGSDKDPQGIRTYVYSPRCVFLGNVSQGDSAYGIIDCPEGGTFSWASQTVTLPAGTFYGDAKSAMSGTESEILSGLNSTPPVAPPRRWDGV